MIGAASGDAAAILCAEDKAALEHVGDNGHTLGMRQNFFRNSIIWRCHDFMQNSSRMIQTVVGCFAIGSSPADTGHAE